MSFIWSGVKVAVAVGASYYQGQQQKKAQNSANAAQKKADKKAKKEQYYIDRRARREARKQEEIKQPFSVTLQVQNSMAPRRLAYGRCRLGGIWFFIESAGGDNDLLYRTFGWSEGPCELIETVYLDEDIPTLDANGVGTGVYLHDIVIRNHTAGEFDSSERAFTVGTNSIIFASDVTPALAVGDMITMRSTATLPTGLAGVQQVWLLANLGGNEWTVTSTLYHLDLITPVAPALTISGGSGTHYAIRRMVDGMSVYQTANWKPDQHKLLGISYSVVLLSAGAVSGGQFTSVPEISAVGQWKRDILDPRQKFTVSASDITSGVGGWIYQYAHGLISGQVIVAYGTPGADGLVTGGLTHGRQYQVLHFGAGSAFRVTEKYGEDAFTLTSLDTGDTYFIPGFYTNNAALCLANYLSEEVKGPNIDFWEGINQAQLEAAADICDEPIETLGSTAAAFTFNPADVNTAAYTITKVAHGMIDGDLVRFTSATTLPTGLVAGADYYVGYVDADKITVKSKSNGLANVVISTTGTGTHSIFRWDKRYTCDGALDMSEPPNQIIDNFKLAMGMADIPYLGGQFHIFPGVYEIPDFQITTDMITGPITRSNVSSRLHRVNEVSGRYYAEVNKWQPFDFPVMESAAYKAADGETLRENLDFPLTKSSAAVQRLAKIVMEESRMQQTLAFTCNLRAFPCLAAKTVSVTIPKYGFAQKVFRIERLELVGDPGADIEISLQLVEWESSIYDWDYTVDEQAANVAASILNPGKKVQDVVASPAGGAGNSFPMTSAVTLSCATSGATIRYNVGTAVTAPQLDTEGTLYSAAITVASNGDKIAAKAFRTGYQASDDMDETYTT